MRAFFGLGRTLPSSLRTVPKPDSVAASLERGQGRGSAGACWARRMAATCFLHPVASSPADVVAWCLLESSHSR